MNVHGSWNIGHALLAFRLRRADVPYVVTAHGGHTRAVLWTRSRLRGLYLRFVERPMLRAAGAVLYCHRSEADEAASVVGDGIRAELAWFGPDLRAVAGRWSPDPENVRRRVLYLGRYDVFQKGLDDLVELARAAPTVTFELHGMAPDNDRALEAFERLRAAAPPNVTFDDPVSGVDKLESLTSATLYIQYSRFEGFPLSISEALAHGVPVASRACLGCTQEMAEVDGCLVLDDDPAVAARQLTEVLDDPERLSKIAENGRCWFEQFRDPSNAAQRYTEMYRSVLGRTSPG